jgi:hypothetical protein
MKGQYVFVKDNIVRSAYLFLTLKKNRKRRRLGKAHIPQML